MIDDDSVTIGLVRVSKHELTQLFGTGAAIVPAAPTEPDEAGRIIQEANRLLEIAEGLVAQLNKQTPSAAVNLSRLRAGGQEKTHTPAAPTKIARLSSPRPAAAAGIRLNTLKSEVITKMQQRFPRGATASEIKALTKETYGAGNNSVYGCLHALVKKKMAVTQPIFNDKGIKTKKRSYLLTSKGLKVAKWIQSCSVVQPESAGND
jgi:hypothetical protein